MVVSDTYNFGFEVGFQSTGMDFLTGVYWQPPLSDGQIGRGQHFYTYGQNPLERQFSLLLERISLTSARFSVFDDRGSVLAQYNETVGNIAGRPTPTDLFVALGGYGSLSYDNLRLTGVPEPAAAISVAGIMAFTIRRRRYGASH
jgi:hypothetical protein